MTRTRGARHRGRRFAGVATAYHAVPPGGGRARRGDRRREDGRAGARDANRREGRRRRLRGGRGLAHLYTPRGKIIWRGTEGVAATLELVEAAENAERVMEAARHWNAAATLASDGFAAAGAPSCDAQACVVPHGP